MKIPKRMFIILTAALAFTLLVGATAASTQRPIVLGQTEGWANGKLAVFDYTQNFFCSNAPLNEALCKVGESISPSNVLKLDPAKIPDLIVIVPFFDANGDGTLEAFAANPSVFAQCPETQSSALNGGTSFGMFGHCVLHDTTLDLSPLTGVPVTTNIGTVTLGGTIPLPNHTHIVKDAPGGSVPWDIMVVLVLDPAIWPDANGNCPAGSGCLTSFNAVFNAPSGSIVGPVPTTLVLFFGVHDLHP